MAPIWAPRSPVPVLKLPVVLSLQVIDFPVVVSVSLKLPDWLPDQVPPGATVQVMVVVANVAGAASPITNAAAPPTSATVRIPLRI